MRLRYGLLVAIVVVFGMYGCSKSPEKMLVGRWIEIDKPNPSISEFFPDGTFVIQAQGQGDVLLGPSQVTGSWIMLEDGRLKMSIPVLIGEPRVMTPSIKFEEDRLVMAGDVGKPSTLKRYEPK